MARNILAELSVILKDGVSGKAKEVVQSLKGIDKAAADLGKSAKGGGLDKTAAALDKINKAAVDLAKTGGKMGDWGANFDRRLTRLGANAADIEKLRASFLKLNQELNSVGSKGSLRTNALQAWKAEASAALLKVQAEARATDRALSGIGKNAGGLRAYNRELSALSNLTRTLGFGGAAYATQRAARAGGAAAFDYHRETAARQVASGISPMDRVALQGRSMQLSNSYRSVGATEVNELGRALYNMTGDMPKALGLLEDFTKAFVVLQSAKGVKGASDELNDFSKALDIFGRQDSPEEMRAIMNSALKATQVEGRQLPLTEFLKLAKYAKSAGAALSPEFIGAIAPSFMQEAGGQRTGTALGSTIAQLVAGRATKKAKEAQAEAGIQASHEVTDKKGKKRRVYDGVVDPALLMSNPYDWAQKHLGPAMEKQGFDPRAAGQEANVTQFMSKIFSNQMVADIFTKMFTQFNQIERNRKQLYPAAKGLDFAKEAPGADPWVALEGVFAQLKNLAAVLGEAGVTDSVVSGLNGLSSGISALNQALGSGSGAEIAAHLTLIAGGLIALRAAMAGWGLLKLLGGLGGGGAASAAAAAAGGAATGGVAAAGGAAAATAGGRMGLRFIPGVGWAFMAGETAYRIYKGDSDVKPGDSADRQRSIDDIGRRWRRGPDVRRTPVAGGPGFGLGGVEGGSQGSSVGSGLSNFGLQGGTYKPNVDTSSLDDAKAKTDETKNKLGELNTTVKPNVDASALTAALAQANALIAALQQIPAAAGAAAAAVKQKVGNEARQAVRSLYSDYGAAEGGQ